MVVGDLFAVTDLRRIDCNRRITATDTGAQENNGIHRGLHIIGEESAVGTGIGGKLFLIEALEIIQRLLCCIAELTVRVSLERGQVIEKRRFFGFLFALNALNGDTAVLAVIGNTVRFALIPKLLGRSLETAAV